MHTRINDMNNIEIAEQFRKYLEETDVTLTSIAVATNTHQSQVSRVKSGDFKKVTENVKRICGYANISVEVARKDISAGKSILIKAIDDVWDKTEPQAKALAKVIRSLKNLT